MARRSGQRKGKEEALEDRLESVLESVRQLWAAAEASEPAQRAFLRGKIMECIERLGKQINGKVRVAEVLRKSTGGNEAQITLFDIAEPPAEANEQRRCKPVKKRSGKTVARFEELQIRIFDKDLTAEASEYLPQANRFDTMEQYKDFLTKNLPFNSVGTRARNASRIVNRFFPGGHLHRDLTTIAAAATGHSCLRDVLFYLTCRTEKILALTAESVVWPSLPDGGVVRKRLTEYVKYQYPGAKRSTETAQTIVRAYEKFGVGKATRSRLNVAIRRGHLASFAYILHLEFPKPGMYSFEKLLDGAMHKWLLWDRDWMIQQLYSCRHEGLLTKVSEIDAMRQFTTKYPLAEAVDRIVPLFKGGES